MKPEAIVLTSSSSPTRRSAAAGTPISSSVSRSAASRCEPVAGLDDAAGQRDLPRVRRDAVAALGEQQVGLVAAVVEHEQHRRPPARVGQLGGPAVPERRGQGVGELRGGHWTSLRAPVPILAPMGTADPILLQPEDLAILALECETVAGHACKVVTLGEGAPDLADLREAIGRRLAGAPS